MSPASKKLVFTLSVCSVVLTGGLAVYWWLIPSRVLTPFQGKPPLSPLYAFWQPALSFRICWAVLAGTVYMVWCRLISHRITTVTVASAQRLIMQCAGLALLALTVATIRLPLDDLGASMHVYPGEDFWDDVPHVRSPGWFLANFTHLHQRNELSLHGRTHPPGHTLFLWVVAQVFGRDTEAAALAILAVGCTAVIPVFLLASRVFGERVARRVLVLFPAVPGITMFAVSSTDFLFASLAAWSLWLAIEAVLGWNPVVAMCAGLLGGLAVTFSVAEAFIGVMAALFALARWIDGSGPAVPRQLACMATGLLAWFCLLRLGFGFDFLECLRLTRRFHHTFITQVLGGMSPGTWLYTSVGNLLAFASYLGIPVLAGAVLSLARTLRQGLWTSAMDQQFTRAFWLVLAIMSCCGLFVLEVERIWLFLIGPLLALSCRALPDLETPQSESRWMVGMIGIMCLQSVVYESLLFTIW